MFIFFIFSFCHPYFQPSSLIGATETDWRIQKKTKKNLNHPKWWKISDSLFVATRGKKNWVDGLSSSFHVEYSPHPPSAPASKLKRQTFFFLVFYILQSRMVVTLQVIHILGHSFVSFNGICQLHCWTWNLFFFFKSWKESARFFAGRFSCSDHYIYKYLSIEI